MASARATRVARLGAPKRSLRARCPDVMATAVNGRRSLRAASPSRDVLPGSVGPATLPESTKVPCARARAERQSWRVPSGLDERGALPQGSDARGSAPRVYLLDSGPGLDWSRLRSYRGRAPGAWQGRTGDLPRRIPRRKIRPPSCEAEVFAVVVAKAITSRGHFVDARATGSSCHCSPRDVRTYAPQNGWFRAVASFVLRGHTPCWWGNNQSGPVCPGRRTAHV